MNVHSEELTGEYYFNFVGQLIGYESFQHHLTQRSDLATRTYGRKSRHFFIRNVIREMRFVPLYNSTNKTSCTSLPRLNISMPFILFMSQLNGTYVDVKRALSTLVINPPFSRMTTLGALCRLRSCSLFGRWINIDLEMRRVDWTL